jgi:hypothetical protein
MKKSLFPKKKKTDEEEESLYIWATVAAEYVQTATWLFLNLNGKIPFRFHLTSSCCPSYPVDYSCQRVRPI